MPFPFQHSRYPVHKPKSFLRNLQGAYIPGGVIFKELMFGWYFVLVFEYNNFKMSLIVEIYTIRSAFSMKNKASAYN